MSARSGNLTVEELGKRSAVAGSLAELPALDLLQAIHDSRRSAALSIRSAEQHAVLFFRDGDIIDAELGSLHGERAVYQALTWTEGFFKVEFHEISREDAMRTSTRRVLWEGRRRIDERRRRVAQLPDLGTVFDVNCERLLETLAELPDEMNLVLKHFEAGRPLREILLRSELDELTTLAAFARLIADRVIYDVASPLPQARSIAPEPSDTFRIPAVISTLPPPRLSMRSTLDYEMNVRDRGALPARSEPSPLPERLPGERTLRGIPAPRVAVQDAADSLPPLTPTSNRPTVPAAPVDERLEPVRRRPEPARRRVRRKRSTLQGMPPRRVRTFAPPPANRNESRGEPTSATTAAAAPIRAAIAAPSRTPPAQVTRTRIEETTAPRSRGARTALALALVMAVIIAMVLIARQLAAR